MELRDANNQGTRYGRAIAVFKKHGGLLRTAQALRAGIHPGTIYAMRNSGALAVVSRGVYRLADNPPLGNPDLVTVATRVPGGVICLISALAFHELTTQIPHEVHVALPRGAEEPRVDHPPIKTYRFTGEAFTEGVKTHELDGIGVHIYSPEKTLADCFKFRNKIGLDTVVEAVRFYRERRRVKVDDLMRYASICRVEKIIRPYLEALLCSEAEERDFWAKEDSSEFIDWKAASRVTFSKLKPSLRTISLRLPEMMIEELKLLSNKMDVPYQTLIKIYLSERM